MKCGKLPGGGVEQPITPPMPKFGDPCGQWCSRRCSASYTDAGLGCHPYDEREVIVFKMPCDLPTPKCRKVDTRHDKLIDLCPTPVALSVALQRPRRSVNSSSGQASLTSTTFSTVREADNEKRKEIMDFPVLKQVPEELVVDVVVVLDFGCLNKASQKARATIGSILLELAVALLHICAKQRGSPIRIAEILHGVVDVVG